MLCCVCCNYYSPNQDTSITALFLDKLFAAQVVLVQKKLDEGMDQDAILAHEDVLRELEMTKQSAEEALLKLGEEYKKQK